MRGGSEGAWVEGVGWGGRSDDEVGVGVGSGRRERDRKREWG